MKKLRRFAALTMVTATALLLVACGGQPSSSVSGSGGQNSAASAPEIAPIEFKFTSPNAASGTPYEGSLHLVDELEKTTEGRIDVAFYPAAQLADKQQSLEGMVMGTIEMAEVSASDLAQFNEIWDVLSLPYHFESGEQCIAVMNDPKVKEITDKALADAGFVLLQWRNVGARSIINNLKPIETPEDLEGMKIRLMASPGLIAAFEGFGASPISLAWSECYTGLQQKTVDAIENSVPVLVGDGYHEIGTYFSDTKHFIIPNMVLASKSVIESLPADLRSSVMEACDASAEYWNGELWPAAEVSDLEKMKAAGVQINTPDLTPFMDKALALNEETVAGFSDSQMEFYNALLEARDKH